jgi:hypothetical protein
MKKILVKAALCGGILLGSEAVSAQEICGYDAIAREKIAKDPSLQVSYDRYKAESFRIAELAQQQTGQSANKTTEDVLIPVVFHIILTQAQIDAIGGTAGIYNRVGLQIISINDDFNATNSDTASVPTRFKSKVGNPGIRFNLAHRMPNGSATDGIEIRTAGDGFAGFAKGDGNAKKYSGGGLDPWDNTKYLNIWIVNFTTSGLLGYGYSPDYANALGVPHETGIVVHYGAFGTKNTSNQTQYWYSSSATKGRTLTHEMGHFFNLWHVWGNTQPGDGKCTDDDGINDTPVQSDNNYSCPSVNGSVVKPNCSGSTYDPAGEMYMNFMDYSGDNCTHMFSKGQVTVMKQAIGTGGGSNSLTKNPQLTYWPTSISSVEKETMLNVSPNPTTGMVNIAISNTNHNLKAITIINALGQTVKQITPDGNTSTYQADLSGMAKGIYTVHCRFEDGIVIKKVIVQ